MRTTFLFVLAGFVLLMIAQPSHAVAQADDFEKAVADVSKATTGTLVTMLHTAIRNETGQPGESRRFYKAERKSPLHWFQSHQQLIAIVAELDKRKVKVVKPLLLEYFDELSKLMSTKTSYMGQTYSRMKQMPLGFLYKNGAAKHIVLPTTSLELQRFQSPVEFGSSYQSKFDGAVALLLMKALDDAIESLGDPSVAELQKGLLDDEPSIVAQSLRCIPHNETIPRGYAKELRKYLQNDDDHVKCEAALALLAFDSSALPEAVGPIRHGIRLLGKKRATAAMVDILLREHQTKTRMLAIELLGEIGPYAKTAVRPLVAILNDEEIELRLAAAEALEKIDPVK